MDGFGDVAALTAAASGVIIGGERRPASPDGKPFRHYYPGDGSPTGTVTLATAGDVDDAVKAARQGFLAWRALGPDGRRAAMLRVADLFEEHGEELAKLVILDIGTPVALSGGTGRRVAEHFRYYAGWADKLGGQVVPTWPGPAFDYTLDEPFGVVGIILPWNGPLGSMGMVAAPALAAGNAVVIKPPEVAPYEVVRAGELFAQAGFPPGVVNIVVGGPEAGHALATHPGIDKLHFTGSGATARKILAATQQSLLPVDLELGGKSANLVFEDADLDKAAQRVVDTTRTLSGQVCAAGTRVLVSSAIHDAFVERCAALAAATVIGDPLDGATQMGPVASALACDSVLGHINRAVEAKAGRLVHGGRRKGGALADGYFIEPTIFDNVDPASDLAQKEIFGPVVAIIGFDTEEEAVALANGTEFGLAAYVQTHDVRRAHRLAAALTAGSVFVNGFRGVPMSAPFGGVKSSGWGRIGGQEGVRQFTRPKNVWLDLS